MPTARSNLTATDVNGLIYVIGGQSCTSSALNTVEQYSPPATILTFIKN